MNHPFFRKDYNKGASDDDDDDSDFDELTETDNEKDPTPEVEPDPPVVAAISHLKRDSANPCNPQVFGHRGHLDIANSKIALLQQLLEKKNKLLDCLGNLFPQQPAALAVRMQSMRKQASPQQAIREKGSGGCVDVGDVSREVLPAITTRLSLQGFELCSNHRL